MDTYNQIDIYTERDFAPGTTIRGATQQLATQRPSLIIFGRQLSGINIGVGEHTRDVAEIIAALTEQGI